MLDHRRPGEEILVAPREVLLISGGRACVRYPATQGVYLHSARASDIAKGVDGQMTAAHVAGGRQQPGKAWTPRSILDTGVPAGDGYCPCRPSATTTGGCWPVKPHAVAIVLAHAGLDGLLRTE